MIASDKQVVHMYVNARLPLAGGLIKQTSACSTHFFSAVTSFLWVDRMGSYF